jgi:hypothetical protein
MPSRRLRMKQSGRFRPSWTSPAEAEQLHMVCSSEGYLCPPRSGGEREGRGATSRAALVSSPTPMLVSLATAEASLRRLGKDGRQSGGLYLCLCLPTTRYAHGGRDFHRRREMRSPSRHFRFRPDCSGQGAGGGISIAPAGSPMQSFDSPRGGQRKTENAPATVCPLWGPAIGPSLFCASLYHSAALVREGVFP